MPWPTQTPDLNPVDHMGYSRQTSVKELPLFHHPSVCFTELLVEWCHIPIQFYMMVDPKQWHAQALLATRGHPTPCLQI